MIEALLEKTVVGLIKYGYRFFGAGGARGFDTMAALTVLRLKKQYPHIRLILVLPCHGQTRRWNAEDIELYESIKKRADKVVYISESYSVGCMLKRNRHLVEHSSVCVCYLTERSGGTAYTVRYADTMNVGVINIASAPEPSPHN